MLKLALVVAGLALGVSASLPDQDAQDPQKEFQGWATSSDRKCSRLIYFHKTVDKTKPWNSSPGEVAIEYGLADWKAGYTEQFEKMKRRYWRLGKNHWTNLDARCPVEIGGVDIPVGYYYLAVYLDGDDNWFLELLDPDKMIANELDAWHINRREVPKGIRVPLDGRKVAAIADVLDIQFELTDKQNDQRKARLEIRFGPHELTADVRVKI